MTDPAALSEDERADRMWGAGGWMWHECPDGKTGRHSIHFHDDPAGSSGPAPLTDEELAEIEAGHMRHSPTCMRLIAALRAKDHQRYHVRWSGSTAGCGLVGHRVLRRGRARHRGRHPERAHG